MASSNDNDDSENQRQAKPLEAEPGRREATGRELLAAAKSGDLKLDEMMDPRVAAELARWFELPSFDQLAERGVAVEQSPEDEETDRRRNAAMAAAQPQFLEHIERWNTQVPDFEFDSSYAEQSAVKFSQITTVIESFSTRLIVREPTDRIRPMDIDDAITVCTPQALLRDLYRVAENFPKTFELTPTRNDMFNAPIASQFEPIAVPMETTRQRLDQAKRLLREVHTQRWEDSSAQRVETPAMEAIS
jgi:hypothetical protein